MSDKLLIGILFANNKELLKKYISYARNKIRPRLTQ